jgi:hypothetical protein
MCVVGASVITGPAILFVMWHTGNSSGTKGLPIKYYNLVGLEVKEPRISTRIAGGLGRLHDFFPVLMPWIHSYYSKDRQGLMSSGILLDHLWRQFLLTLVFSITRLVTLSIMYSLPPWQRLLMHPNVVELHQRRVWITIFSGWVLVIPFILATLFSSRQLNPDNILRYLAQLGLFYLLLGLTTLPLTHFQKWLSKRNSAITEGNGFGLLNVVLFMSNRRPSHILTWIQDIAIISICFFLVGFARKADCDVGTIFVGVFLAIAIGYNWYCHIRFRHGDAIAFV